MVLYSNYIVLEHGIFEGFLELENGKIKGLYEKWQGEYKDYSDKIIFPGFIDIHVHGWATGSFWFEKTSQLLLIWEPQGQIPLRRSRPVSGLLIRSAKKILRERSF